MPLVERLAVVLESVGSSAVVKDFGKVSGAAEGLGATSKKAAGLLQGLGGAGAGVSGMLAGGVTAAASAAAAGLVSFGVKSVNSYHDAVMAAVDFQRASGATMEQSSALVAAFDDVGISAETGSKGIFQLGKRLGETGDGLKAYGVTAARGADGTIDLSRTLLNVADAYVGTQDPARRAQLLTAAFGKSGQDLIPILERGRAGIEAMFGDAAKSGQVFGAEDRTNVLAYNAALDDLHDAVNEITLAVGTGLVPKLTQIAVATTILIDKAKSLADSPFGPWLKRGLEATSPLLSGLHLLSNALDLVDTSAVDAAGGLGTFGGSTGDASGDAAELDSKLKGLESSLLGVASAERARDQAARAVTTAEQHVADARQKVNDVLKEGWVDEKKVESATRDLAAATRSHERALHDQGEAQATVNKLTQELQDLTSGKVGAEKSADAQDDLTQAQLRQRTATQRVMQAQVNLNNLALDATSTAYDYENAQIDLAQANLDLKNANEDLTGAQEALDAAQLIGAENSPEVIAKRGELKDATYNLDEKTQALTSSTADLTAKTDALKAAQAGDPVQYSKDLAGARRDLKDAEDGLAGARGTLAQRTYDLIGAQDTLNTKLATGDSTASLLKGKFEDMIAKNPQVATFLDPLLTDLDAAIKLLGTQIAVGGGSLPVGALRGLANIPLPVHAAGGVATRPTMGIFGEAGPEALVPLDRYGGLGAATNITYQLTVNSLDPQAASDTVIGAIVEFERRNGTSWRN